MARTNARRRTQMTALLRNVVLPLPQKADDETEWVNRLLLVASHIDESAMNTLLGNTNLLGFARCVKQTVRGIKLRQLSRGSYPYRAFVATCEENNVSLNGVSCCQPSYEWYREAS